MTAANIADGFEITGIYPLNRKAVRLPVEVKVHKKIVPNLTFSPASCILVQKDRMAYFVAYSKKVSRNFSLRLQNVSPSGRGLSIMKRSIAALSHLT